MPPGKANKLVVFGNSSDHTLIKTLNLAAHVLKQFVKFMCPEYRWISITKILWMF